MMLPERFTLPCNEERTLVALTEEYADVLSAIFYAGKMSDAFKVFARKRSHVDIDALKTRFENALAISSKRIVVMMDDIDRLDKAEIHTVFRLVKLLGDFPNTTYVCSSTKNELRRRSARNTSA